MSKVVEIRLGDIRVEANEDHIYMSKLIEGTPGKIIVGYELNADGETCKQVAGSEITQEKTSESRITPFRISMTDEDDHTVMYTKDSLLNIISHLDAEPQLRGYLYTLVISDFEALEEIWDEGPRIYDYDEEIKETLKENIRG